MAFDRYPGIDETGQLPAEVRQRILENVALDGAPRAEDSHTYKWMAGVMRNVEGEGWAFLPTSSNHRPVNVDSVSVVGNTLRVDYTSAGAVMTVVAMAQPDETLAGAGFSMGCSVTPTRTDITIYQTTPAFADYISWDTVDSMFKSTLGEFQVVSFSGGILRLTHAATPGNSYDLAITPRGRNWDFVPRTGSPAVDGTDIYLELTDVSPAIQGEVLYNGATWTAPVGWSAVFDGVTGILTITHPAIGPGASQRANVLPRATSYSVELPVEASPMTTTSIAIRFRDAAGTPVLAPTTSMRIWIERGGGGAAVSTGQPGMAFWIRHGGGHRVVSPNTINTTDYPLSNIWFYAVHGMEGGA